MKDGYVKVSINNVLISGVAGSGKTSLKLMLTNKPPPQQRNSTPCMEKPVRVQPVSSAKYKTMKTGWAEINDEDVLDLLARTIAKHQERTSASPFILHPRESTAQSFWSKIIRAFRKLIICSKANPDPQTPQESNLKHTYEAPPVIDAAINAQIERVVSEVAHELEFASQQSELSSDNDQGGELFDSTWMYISDCGGQPQFHDISALFMPHISVALFIFRLIDDFSKFPLDEYYKDGQLVGIPHASHMTLGETLKSLIRSIESHCSKEKRPNLIFVGTFLDQLKNLAALDEKNQAVVSMVSGSVAEQVVYPDAGMKHPVFAINALSRDENTQKIAADIRNAIERCHKLVINMPVWWFVLDSYLQKLSSTLNRGVLSKQECLLLAIRFGFNLEHLEAALNFFDNVCIAHYYPSILPNTVFVNAQIPLDKITELTEHAIALRDATAKPCSPHSGEITKGKWRRFRDEGVVTLEFLQLERFKKHYVDGIFSPEDMLLIMKELLVIAPIPIVGESDCPLSKAEFFMPSLLKSCPPTELVEYRITSANISPINIFFPSGCIRSGVFCCLVVHLIKVLKWKVLLPSGELVFLARNCVKFRFPSHTGTVTLIDSFSYIEVYVNALPSVVKKHCGSIRDQLLNGIKAACDTLHYDNDEPSITIFCPCSSKVHLAEVYDDGTWNCFLQADKCGDLAPESRVWWDKTVDTQGETLIQVDDLMGLSDVSKQQLDAEISEGDFHTLGGNFDSISGLFESLGLNPAERADVSRIANTEGTQAGVAHALRLWKRVDPSRATYRALIKIVVSLRRRDIATEICKYLVDSNH